MIPAKPYFEIVRQYAQARGLNFFTWTDMQIAARLYEEFAKLNN